MNIVPEVVAGFPDRLIPINDEAAAELKTRTLTKLYNTRPAWLTEAHQRLDVAVAGAYGWDAEIADEKALGGLLKLNAARAGAQPSDENRGGNRGKPGKPGKPGETGTA